MAIARSAVQEFARMGGAARADRSAGFTSRSRPRNLCSAENTRERRPLRTASILVNHRGVVVHG
jgi:hypothetical protein